MNKRIKKKKDKLTGLFLTNAITDNKETKNGEIVNAHASNAVFARETSETLRL